VRRRSDHCSQPALASALVHRSRWSQFDTFILFSSHHLHGWISTTLDSYRYTVEEIIYSPISLVYLVIRTIIRKNIPLHSQHPLVPVMTIDNTNEYVPVGKDRKAKATTPNSSRRVSSGKKPSAFGRNSPFSPTETDRSL